MSQKPIRIEFRHKSEQGEYPPHGWSPEADLDLPSAQKALTRAREYLQMTVEQEEDTWVNIRAKDFYEMQVTIRVLKRQIGTLTRTVKQIQSLQTEPKAPEVQQIREITIEEAEGLVEGYMEKKGQAYPSDIASELGIPLRITMEALDHLERDGVVQKTK